MPLSDLLKLPNFSQAISCPDCAIFSAAPTPGRFITLKGEFYGVIGGDSNTQPESGYYYVGQVSHDHPHCVPYTGLPKPEAFKAVTPLCTTRRSALFKAAKAELIAKTQALVQEPTHIVQPPPPGDNYLIFGCCRPGRICDPTGFAAEVDKTANPADLWAMLSPSYDLRWLRADDFNARQIMQEHVKNCGRAT